MTQPPNLRGVVEAALEIARERRETLAQLRAALEKGENEKALRLARRLCGLEINEERHRTNPCIN